MPDQSSASRRACKWALVVCLAAVGGCATGAGPGLRAGERAETARTTTSPSSSTRRFAPTPMTTTRVWRSSARSCARRNSTPFAGARSPAKSATNRRSASIRSLRAESSDALVAEALRDVRQKLRTKIAVTRNGKTELESLIERSRALRLQASTCRPTPSFPTRSSSARPAAATCSGRLRSLPGSTSSLTRAATRLSTPTCAR